MWNPDTQSHDVAEMPCRRCARGWRSRFRADVSAAAWPHVVQYVKRRHSAGICRKFSATWVSPAGSRTRVPRQRPNLHAGETRAATNYGHGRYKQLIDLILSRREVKASRQARQSSRWIIAAVSSSAEFVAIERYLELQYQPQTPNFRRLCLFTYSKGRGFCRQISRNDPPTRLRYPGTLYTHSPGLQPLHYNERVHPLSRQ